MNYLENSSGLAGSSIQNLSHDEIENVAGGPAIALIPIVKFVAASAAAGAIGTATVGFVDGLIQGFQDDE